MGAVPAKKVRVAIVGVGNCASSLVQGLEYYRDAADDARVPGLMHVRFRSEERRVGKECSS